MITKIISTKIKLNKQHIFLIILILGLLFMFCILGVSKPENYTSALYRFPLIIFLISTIGIITVPLCIYLLLEKLFDKNYGLIISEEGIYENSNFSSIGLINWNDIEKIKRLDNNNYTIILKKGKEEFYYNKTNNILKKMIMRMNLWLYKSPIIITSQTLNIRSKQLAELLEKNVA